MLSVGFARLVFIQFFGSRVPPTTSIQKIGFRLPVKAEHRCKAVPPTVQPTQKPDFTTVNSYIFESGSKKCTPSRWNPCSPSFSSSATPVHDQLEIAFAVGRRTL